MKIYVSDGKKILINLKSYVELKTDKKDNYIYTKITIVAWNLSPLGQFRHLRNISVRCTEHHLKFNKHLRIILHITSKIHDKYNLTYIL